VQQLGKPARVSELPGVAREAAAAAARARAGARGRDLVGAARRAGGGARSCVRVGRAAETGALSACWLMLARRAGGTDACARERGEAARRARAAAKGGAAGALRVGVLPRVPREADAGICRGGAFWARAGRRACATGGRGGLWLVLASGARKTCRLRGQRAEGPRRARRCGAAWRPEESRPSDAVGERCRARWSLCVKGARATGGRAVLVLVVVGRTRQACILPAQRLIRPGRAKLSRGPGGTEGAGGGDTLGERARAGVCDR